MNLRACILTALILLALTTGVLSAHAQTNTGNDGGGMNTGTRLVNPLGEGITLSKFLMEILDIVTDIIGPIIVILMLVYVGFLFVTAQGSESKIRDARQALLWTVVGALILLGAKAIALGIQATVDALKV